MSKVEASSYSHGTFRIQKSTSSYVPFSEFFACRVLSLSPKSFSLKMTAEKRKFSLYFIVLLLWMEEDRVYVRRSILWTLLSASSNRKLVRSRARVFRYFFFGNCHRMTASEQAREKWMRVCVRARAKPGRNSINSTSFILTLQHYWTKGQTAPLLLIGSRQRGLVMNVLAVILWPSLVIAEETSNWKKAPALLWYKKRIPEIRPHKVPLAYCFLESMTRFLSQDPARPSR